MDLRFSLWRPGDKIPELTQHPVAVGTHWSGWCWLATKEWDDVWPGYFERNEIHVSQGTPGGWFTMDSWVEVEAWIPAFVPKSMRRGDL